MREPEYRRTRKQILAELKSAEDTVARVQAKLTALDLLWQEHFSKQSHENSCNSSDLSPKTEVVNGQAQMMVDEAARAITGDFGVKDIELAIQVRHPDKIINRTTIAGRLKKLADDGVIDLIVAGVGRRPGKFRGKAA